MENVECIVVFYEKKIYRMTWFSRQFFSACYTRHLRQHDSIDRNDFWNASCPRPTHIVWYPVYTIQPVWQSAECLYTRYNRLTTGCIVYTNIYLVVKRSNWPSRYLIKGVSHNVYTKGLLAVSCDKQDKKYRPRN